MFYSVTKNYNKEGLKWNVADGEIMSHNTETQHMIKTLNTTTT